MRKNLKVCLEEPGARMILKDYSDKEAVRPREQGLAHYSHKKKLVIWCMRRSDYGLVWSFSILPVPKNNQLPKIKFPNALKSS